MQHTITVSVSEDYLPELNAIALKEGKTLEEVIHDVLRIGCMVSRYVGPESQVIVNRAKGFDDNAQVLLPVHGMSARK